MDKIDVSLPNSKFIVTSNGVVEQATLLQFGRTITVSPKRLSVEKELAQTNLTNPAEQVILHLLQGRVEPASAASIDKEIMVAGKEELSEILNECY